MVWEGGRGHRRFVASQQAASDVDRAGGRARVSDKERNVFGGIPFQPARAPRQEHLHVVVDGRPRRSRADGAELERLVVAAARGSAPAWAALVERFTGRLRAVVGGRRVEAHEAEDVVQTPWLRLVEEIDRVREPRAVGAWLETTARRESLRTRAAGRRERVVEDQVLEPQAGEPLDSDRLVAAERRAALCAALGDLRPLQRALLVMLVADAGPSYAEISRTLGVPIGSIGPTRQRGLERLRRNRELLEAVAA